MDYYFRLTPTFLNFSTGPVGIWKQREIEK